MPDAIIIGGGPAGCIAAILLARGGWNVRVVEQHRFPRDKVCGECLSALGYSVLERIGLDTSFQQLSPVRLDRSLIHAPNGRTLSVDLPQPMWGVSRLLMDRWLLDEAAPSGATILQPARCEQIVPHLIIRDLQTNQLDSPAAQWVLLADGKRALGGVRPALTGDLGIKAHFQGITGPREAIELFGVDGHYGGLAPIEGGLWNAAFSVPQKRVQRSKGDLDRMFDQIVRENVVLKERFQSATRASGWLTSPLPRFAVARTWPSGVIPLGNAAASIEPVGGEGMGLAMRSAELAATMLLSGDVDLNRLRGSFRRLWQTRRVSCRAAGILVSNPSIAKWIALTVGKSKPAARAMMRLMGK